MAEAQTMTQVVQMGLEDVHGTSPAGGADLAMPTLKWDVDPDFATNQYAASGERFDSASVPSQEKSKLKLDATASYVEQAYIHAMIWGNPAITTPAGAIRARKFAWPVPLTGLIDGRTALLQKGDSVRARSVNFAQLTGINVEFDRKECKLTGDAIAQAITDGITLTPTPTAVKEKEVQPKHWNVYLDDITEEIGQTLLARCFSVKFGYTDAYGDIWPIGRSNASFGAVVNKKPKNALTLSLMADEIAGALWTPARAGQKRYIRLEAISEEMIDNLQTITISGAPTAGDFTLTYKAQTTAPIAFDATAAAVQSALEALSTIGVGNVSVTGGPGPDTPWVVAFVGTLAQDTTAMTADGSGLSGGTSPAVALASSSFPYTQIFDICAVPAPDAFGDQDGAFLQDWQFNIVKDPAWSLASAAGTAIYPYLITDLTSL